MKRSRQAPKVKRTRRHVVLRLTPKEAQAAFLMADTSAAVPERLARSRVRVKAILMEASKAADTTPPPAPKRTSIAPSISSILGGVDGITIKKY